jgi:hypothetical protein
VTDWVPSATDWIQFPADWVASRTVKNRRFRKKMHFFAFFLKDLALSYVFIVETLRNVTVNDWLCRGVS